MTKRAKMNTLFLTKMAKKKSIPFRATHAYIAHIVEPPPPLPLQAGQLTQPR